MAIFRKTTVYTVESFLLIWKGTNPRHILRLLNSTTYTTIKYANQWRDLLNISFEKFTEVIADRNGLDKSTVRSVLNTTSEYIIDIANSVPPSEEFTIRPIKGLVIRRLKTNKGSNLNNHGHVISVKMTKRFREKLKQ